MRSWTLGALQDGWQEEAEEETSCENCKYWQNGQCNNPESEYYESMQKRYCDEWKEWNK